MPTRERFHLKFSFENSFEKFFQIFFEKNFYFFFEKLIKINIFMYLKSGRYTCSALCDVSTYQITILKYLFYSFSFKKSI